MKKVIILGGNKNHNIKWLKKMKKVYSKDYDVYDFYYDNWITDTDIDFDIELNKLEELMKNNGEYIIIAKSAGDILSLMGISKGIIKPKKLIMMGLPLMFTEKYNINLKYLLGEASKKTDIMVIQQKYDPLGKVSDIENIISNNIKLVAINGCYHTYTKYEYIKLIVDEFIN